MSEATLISPLLDGFTMGQPISEHDGVSCCPAIKADTEKKYIVKIVTVPATQVQLDALLLAGAYKDPADAMDYYRSVSEDILNEAEFLKKLSQLEGFLSYEGWQMVPITRKRLGYQVYLVGRYKRSLEKHLRRSPVTHLDAINLGLDLCAALAVCRQAGSLYVALKPTNIFVSEKKQYRIGDLGFISLDSLGYTSLPQKYKSAYTPPELFDPMVSVNLTTDTYAVGMILYQLYNDGQLPFRGKVPEEPLPSPVNADYELAEIIMKAIHPDPAHRWSDPAAMGKALASYMQRNAVNDVPITPLTPLAVCPEDVVPPSAGAQADSADVQSEQVPDDASAPEEAEPEEAAPEEAAPEEAAPAEAEADAVTAEPEEAAMEVPAAAADEIPEPEAPNPEPVCPDGKLLPDEDTANAFADELGLLADYPEASQSEPVAPQDEFAGVLAKADDLISHVPPAGVVLPEIAEPEDPFAFAKDDLDEIDDSEIPTDPLMETEEPAPPRKKKAEKKFADRKYQRRAKRLMSTLTFLLALCLAGLAGFWYYQNIYLQAIDQILIKGTRDQLTVVVDTQVKESLLQVTCSDSHGNTNSQPLRDGVAVFSDLKPSTLYTIQLDIDGFHRLVGKTSDVFTTDATTNILSFTSVAGNEDGSVVLRFTPEGEEPDKWIVHYYAENEEPKSETFTGHSVTISGLSVGKKYSFTLEAQGDLTLGGEKNLQLIATRLILAENLQVSSTGDSDLVVRWDTPGDVLVDSWDVRCYSESGYDERVTVTDSEAVFLNADPSVSYTIEVVASGMTKPARVGVTAEPIRVRELTVDDNASQKLTLKWTYDGDKPDDGWLLIYTVDGGGENVVKCAKATAEITPRIPGAKYTFALQSANGVSVLSGNLTYTCPVAEPFNKFAFSLDTLKADLLVTPESGKWYAESIEADRFTDTFASGSSISIALRNSETFYLPGNPVEILYVIRDTYGNALPDFVSSETVYWKNIWLTGSSKTGELHIPRVPTAAGSYVLDLYIDGMLLTTLPFTIQ